MSEKSDGKAWGGVFRVPTDQRVESFSESISFDQRLADDDIDGSIAHSQMLAECGLLTQAEADAIREGLEDIRKDIRNGTFHFTASKEDIHLHIESALTEKLGDTGRKLHTAAVGMIRLPQIYVSFVDVLLIESMPPSLSYKKPSLRWVNENVISSYPHTHTFDGHNLFLQHTSSWCGVKNLIVTDSGLLIVDSEQTSCR